MTKRNTRSGKPAFLLIALVVLAGFQPGPAKTQDIEQLRKDAEQGDATAQYQLGLRYSIGIGVPKDDAEAVRPGFPFWILAASILRSFSLEGKPFLTAGTHRAGPKCLHWTLSFSEGDHSSVGRQFFRHSSELHSAASRFRTRERPFYPLGSGSAQILCSMSPNSLRFRCPSANNNQ